MLYGVGLFLWALVLSAPGAQGVGVIGQIEIAPAGPSSRMADASNVAVWLQHLGDVDSRPAPPPHPGYRQMKLIQKNKIFDPHVMVVEVGSKVEFPNLDPFFHNVFSLFEGKRFDLGLYEAGTSRSVCFDRPGICYIFCNIHPDMSAVVIAVNTPYFGVSDRARRVFIPNVPAGRYELHVWHERSLPSSPPRRCCRRFSSPLKKDAL